jgi:hypothetical protein
MPKYAPANDEGLKPYMVTRAGWGRSSTRLVYADKVATAKYKAFGRMGTGEYITECRRATPEDIEQQGKR